jgi:soluble lytic murein transglycosylase-like protein
MTIRAALAALLWLLAARAGAEARRVEVPLLVPAAFLAAQLRAQVFDDPGTIARIESADAPCNEIVLSEPALAAGAGRIRVTARGEARAGFTLFGACYRPFAWQGLVEAEEDAAVLPGGAVVEFRVRDSWLHDDSDWLAVPAVWDWVKPEVHPRLERLRIDLGPLLGDLRRALPLFAARRDAPAVQRLARSLALADARIDARGLVLSLRFEVEARAAAAEPAAGAAEAPLTREELAAFETALREWDAFLTYVIQAAGADTLDPALRAGLLAVLLDARHEILDALAAPGRDGEDRVRALFLASWTRLQEPLLSLAGGDEGLRYLAFVAAGDALAALDAAGPAFGFEVSRDGLRRFARTLVPDARDDPLHWSEDVDPVLRRTFGFEAELPALPAPEPEPAAEPAPEDEPAPEAPAPPPDSAPAPDGAWRLLDWLLPAAHAAPRPLPKPGPYSSPLDGRAPRLAELDHYLPEVAALLRDAAAQVFSHGRLEKRRRTMFERMVLATAWQESCWRQYVRRRGGVAPLRSSAGALGVMQVNPHVWRGFYSVDGLSRSIGYNAHAGAEILLHYLRDYAMARGEEDAGGPDALVRATYAAYHGGPSHLRRYRQPKRWRSALVAVDRAFHRKYQEVAAGRELGVRECYAG